MPVFTHGNVDVAYRDEGEGEPIVLVHGFASNAEVNWFYPSWASVLKGAGYQVVALDNRGHGASTKLYDPEKYHIGDMSSDVIALMDHLAIRKAHVMGYSLGARISGYLSLQHPERVHTVIFGGLGMALVEGGGPGENVALALEAPSLDDVIDPMGRAFRAFAEQTRSDRRALAACLRGSRRRMTIEEAGRLAMPVLIAVGTTDDVAGSAQRLGQIIPGSEVLDIPGRDHMRAVGDRVYKDGVLDFLARHR